MELIYREEVHGMLGAFSGVYNGAGSGFLEEVYQQALEHELTFRQIPFVSKPKPEIRHKGILISKKYEPDLVIYSKIIMEIKAVTALNDEHRAQLHKCLKASSFKLGLLANSGKPKVLEYERIPR